MLAQTHIKQQLDALRHGNASGFVRLRVAIEVGSFLGWLAAQTLYPRIYWHARGHDRPEYVALGCLRELTEPQAIRQVCEHTSQPHDDSPRYYGGLAFDPTQPGWQGFGPCRFVLPRIELVRRGECVTLCLNLWLPEQTGSEAFEAELQAAAAVGQMGLAQMYETKLREQGLRSAQVLLTHADLADRERYLNARTTLLTLLEYQVLPVINENDTVATDEITSIGDNDTLAAIVTCCIHADLLVLLSDIDGLYTANPHTHPDAKLIPLVEDITPEVMALADGAGSALGTGGMSTKLRAARMVTSSGADMVIANGSHPELLYDIAEGRAAGTRFAAHRQEA